MAPTSFLVLALTISLFYLSIFLSFLHAELGGFSLKLIHRDSPESPFYDPSETHYQRLCKSVRHASERAHQILHSNDIISKVHANGGTYVMNISIGSPPVSMLAVADTGSDLTWIQCKPCLSCYEQEDDIFDPKLSKSYRVVPYQSDRCKSLELMKRCGIRGACEYGIHYGDKSYSYGKISVEKVTFESSTGKRMTFPRIFFGCGNSNGGGFDEKMSGIVGLGNGKLSLVSQLGSSFGGKFSYCLVPLGSSTINFGTNAIVSGLDTISTPFFTGSPETFYNLKLEAVSVGTKKLRYLSYNALGTSDGNIIIDSGTTLTLLPPRFFAKLKDEVSSQIDATPVPSRDNVFRLCYKINDHLKFPTITMHFKNADIKLKDANIFIPIWDITCFAFKDNNDASIYGSVAQMDFLVGYDREQKMVSFKPTDCSLG
ncbi:hypothetical protein ACFE04_028668 [Oxalis oulophora]